MPHAAWNKCLEIIKKNLTAHSIRTWFLPIVPLKLKNNILTIQVPSQFFYEWIEENYLTILRQAIHDTLGKDGKLEYSILIDKGSTQHPPAHMQLPQQTYHAPNKPQTTASATPTGPNTVQGAFQDTLQGMMGGLHKQYTFSHFVSGKSNLMIRQASLAVAETTWPNRL